MCKGHRTQSEAEVGRGKLKNTFEVMQLISEKVGGHSPEALLMEGPVQWEPSQDHEPEASPTWTGMRGPSACGAGGCSQVS